MNQNHIQHWIPEGLEEGVDEALVLADCGVVAFALHRIILLLINTNKQTNKYLPTIFFIFLKKTGINVMQ